MSDVVAAGDAAAVSEAVVAWDSEAMKEAVEVGDTDAVGVAGVIVEGGSLVGVAGDAVDVRVVVVVVVVGERDDGDEIVIGGDDGGGNNGGENAGVDTLFVYEFFSWYIFFDFVITYGDTLIPGIPLSLRDWLNNIMKLFGSSIPRLNLSIR